MKTHLRRLLMCCLLLLILPMAAFAEENELPVEWVRYGYVPSDSYLRTEFLFRNSERYIF